MGSTPNTALNKAWHCKTVISALGRKSQENQKFKVVLSYSVGLRLAWATWDSGGGRGREAKPCPIAAHQPVSPHVGKSSWGLRETDDHSRFCVFFLITSLFRAIKTCIGMQPLQEWAPHKHRSKLKCFSQNYPFSWRNSIRMALNSQFSPQVVAFCYIEKIRTISVLSKGISFSCNKSPTLVKQSLIWAAYKGQLYIFHSAVKAICPSTPLPRASWHIALLMSERLFFYPQNLYFELCVSLSLSSRYCNFFFF